MAVIEKKGSSLEKLLLEVEQEFGNSYAYEVKDTTKKLFKETITIRAIDACEIANEIRRILLGLIEPFEIEVQIDMRLDGNIYYAQMESTNNSILIGKNGQTLKALEKITKSMLQRKWNIQPKMILNVGDYNEQKQNQLIRFAKKIAREVKISRINVSLDPMNSFERRIIHNALTDYGNITTESEGTGANRHIVIKYNESKKD